MICLTHKLPGPQWKACCPVTLQTSAGIPGTHRGASFRLPTCVFAERCVISHQKESMCEDGHN